MILGGEKCYHINLKAIDRARTNEVKSDSNWTTCGIVINSGRLGPWEVPHVA